LAEVPDPQVDLAGYRSDRQRASHDVVAGACDFDLIAFECDPRMILDIEKISAAKVRVTLRLPRPDRRGVDGYLS
jgi:hypothetical protein